MNCYIFLVPLFLTFWAPLAAQSIERAVIASSGLSSQAGNLQLSATTGELAVETYQAGSFTLTQGFQQGDAPTNVSNDLPLVQVEYLLYPNPAKNWVELELDSQVPITLHVGIWDLTGKQTLFPSKVLNVHGVFHQRFDLSKLAVGNYILVLHSRDGQLLRSFRIRKIP